MTDRWPRFINELMIEIRSATYGRKVDPDDLRKNLPLVPAESIASRALVTVIAIMAFLAAFVAGLLFAFAPYRLPQSSHVQVLSSQWMPFALYGIRRYFDGTEIGRAHV